MPKKAFYALLMLGVGALLAALYLPSYSKYLELKREKALLDEELKVIHTEIQDLRKEKNLLENDVEYLERVIRGELGLVEPGEVVYEFVESSPEENPAESTL